MSLSPLFTDDGKVGGLINISPETTITVLTTRRLKTIRDLANGTQGNYFDVHYYGMLLIQMTNPNIRCSS